MKTAPEPRIVSVSGPVVKANNLLGAFLYEVVYVGEQHLIGEIIQLQNDISTIQVYEDTSGLQINAPVLRSYKLLSVELGPGLLSKIYDGIQRPLVDIALQQLKLPLGQRSATFLPKGVQARALDDSKLWYVDTAFYNVKAGQLITQGDLFALIQENHLLQTKIFLPFYGLDEKNQEVFSAGGTVEWIADSGNYKIDDTVLKVRQQNGSILKYSLTFKQPVRTPSQFSKKLPSSSLLITGQRVLDGLFPLTQGATAAIPGAFGCGKTVISQAVSKYSNSDVVVYIGCGERGNEMAEVLSDFPEMRLEVKSGRCEKCGKDYKIDKNGLVVLEDGELQQAKELGVESAAAAILCPSCKSPLAISTSSSSIMDRTVLIANTSNMPVAAREASIYTGITISEYFRDQGYNVTLLADSTSRWAEALREISGRLAELPSEGGYPSYLSSRLSQFYERAGKVVCLGTQRTGSISIIGAVSPQGGDFSDPVAVATMQIVHVFWALSKNLAKRKHFPSIDWNMSYSKCVDKIEFSEAFKKSRETLLSLLQRETSLQETVQLIGFDALGGSEKLILEICKIVKEGFLQQNSYSPYDRYCPIQKTEMMTKNLCDYYQLAQEKIDKGFSFEQVKSDSLTVNEKLWRMKFVDSNTNGLEYAMSELRKLNQEIWKEMGGEL